MGNSTYLLTLIIGYGNTLRGDDGVGRYLADQIAALRWPHCQVLSVHQLTPDLAAAIADVDQVIFMDAQPLESPSSPGVYIHTLQPADDQSTLTHHSTPAALLTLTKVLYGKTVKAWWVLIPGINFAYGETLSPVTQAAQWDALDKIQSLIQSPEDG
ncbi:MAG: hypothetical protein RLZZ490_1287 [Cyanobacteriota bacterium]